MSEWQQNPKIGDGSGDAALFIAEEAFRAGWKAAVDTVFSPDTLIAQTCDDAWSQFEPSEHAKELS